MVAHVYNIVSLLGKRLPTNVTLEGFMTSMTSNVNVKVILSSQHLCTYVTFELLFCAVS